jgi:hypothetical protein
VIPAPHDCRACAACCFSDSPYYVRVTGADWTRLGAAADELAHFIGHRAYLRMRDGHCAALEVRPAADGTRGYFCSIYDRRPQTCRDLERGSPQCEAEVMRKVVGRRSGQGPGESWMAAESADQTQRCGTAGRPVD